MRGRRRFVASVCVLAGAGLVRAQPRAEPARVGFLFAASPHAVAARVDAVRAGLAALGYVEGRQVTFEPRYASGDLRLLPALAAELVALPCAVIVSGGSSATRPLAEATRTIPIVVGQDNDPVAAGVADSYARPGRNVTGLATLTPELSGKQVALLVEIVPGMKRMAILGDGGEAGDAESVAEAARAAASLRVQTVHLDVRTEGGLPQMFAAAARARVDGALVLKSAYMFPRSREVIDLALKSRLPAIYADPEFVRLGGLVTYGVNANDLFRRASGYIVKILNGAKPGELPIEQPRAFDLIINAASARAIGLALPQTVLLRADQVVQ